MGCLVSRAHKTWSQSFLFKDFPTMTKMKKLCWFPFEGINIDYGQKLPKNVQLRFAIRTIVPLFTLNS